MFYCLSVKGQGLDLMGIMTLSFISMAPQVTDINGTIMVTRSTKIVTFSHDLQNVTFTLQIHSLSKVVSSYHQYLKIFCALKKAVKNLAAVSIFTLLALI